MYATGDAEHWRRKYFDALKSLEQQERDFRHIEGLLRRLLARLCSASLGRSAQLDAELKRLVATLRSGGKAPELEALFAPLSDAVVALDSEDVAQAPAQSAPEPGVDAGTPQAASFRLDELSEGRVRAALRQVLELVIQDDALQSRATVLCSMLAAPLPEGRLPDVLTEVAELMSRRVAAIEVEKREIEGLLAQVTGRLDELSQFMGTENADREAGLEGTREFNTRIFQNMSDLGATVADAHDLDQVKARVQTGLDIISAQVQEFRDREEARVRSALERSERMRARVETLETETRTLHDRLRDEQRLAMVDALTQIPNRLAYDQRLGEEYRRWQRFGQPVCIAAWDIDRFKQVNDAYGHKAGDKVLRIVAECLASRIRQTDFVARYGGEEFVMILAGTTMADALQVAEQVRESVGDLGFHFRGVPVSVTVSCGIAQFADGDGIDDAFERADAALYQAKSSGRNRCVTG